MKTHNGLVDQERHETNQRKLAQNKYWMKKAWTRANTMGKQCNKEYESLENARKQWNGQCIEGRKGDSLSVKGWNKSQIINTDQRRHVGSYMGSRTHKEKLGTHVGAPKGRWVRERTSKPMREPSLQNRWISGLYRNTRARIFLTSRASLARSCIAIKPANLPVLQAKGNPWEKAQRPMGAGTHKGTHGGREGTGELLREPMGEHTSRQQLRELMRDV